MGRRKFSSTSQAANEFIKPFKPNHKQKILAALENLKVGGTFEELSLSSGMKESQIWKRLSEMEKDGTVFNTGITRKLKSGMFGTVWQKSGMGIVNPENPKTDKEVSSLHNAGIPVKTNQEFLNDYLDRKLDHPISKSFQAKLF